MSTEQPPFQYHLDFLISHEGDIDAQCKELLFRIRPEWKQQELKNKVGEWHWLILGDRCGNSTVTTYGSHDV